MNSRLTILLAPAFMFLACTPPRPPLARADAQRQVMATERAFAKTMADRDAAAFASFIDSNAVFFSGPTAIHGRTAIVAFWSRFYSGPTAPFSWAPDTVEALETGELALSTGPVYAPNGKLVARFNSIWRREGDSTWRIIFDKGQDVCDCKRP